MSSLVRARAVDMSLSNNYIPLQTVSLFFSRTANTVSFRSFIAHTQHRHTRRVAFISFWVLFISKWNNRLCTMFSYFVKMMFSSISVIRLVAVCARKPINTGMNMPNLPTGNSSTFNVSESYHMQHHTSATNNSGTVVMKKYIWTSLNTLKIDRRPVLNIHSNRKCNFARSLVLCQLRCKRTRPRASLPTVVLCICENECCAQIVKWDRINISWSFFFGCCCYCCCSSNLSNDDWIQFSITATPFVSQHSILSAGHHIALLTHFGCVGLRECNAPHSFQSHSLA